MKTQDAVLSDALKMSKIECVEWRPVLDGKGCDRHIAWGDSDTLEDKGSIKTSRCHIGLSVRMHEWKLTKPFSNTLERCLFLNSLKDLLEHRPRNGYQVRNLNELA